MGTLLSISPPVGVSFSAGRMHLSSSAAVRFWHSAADIFYKDVKVAVEHVNSVNPTPNDYVGAVARRIDGDNELIAAVTGDRLHVMKFEDGQLWDVSSVALLTPLLADQHYWIQARVDDDVFVAAHWDHDPRDGGTELIALEHDLTSSESARFSGNYTFSVGGFWWQADSWQTAVLESFQYEPVKITDTLILEVDHHGNMTAKPVIEFVGEMSDIVLTNEMNGQAIVINGVIPEGESRFADIDQKTFYDEGNNNRYGMLAINNKWMRLEPGTNLITITTSSNKGGSGVKLSWRDSNI